MISCFTIPKSEPKKEKLAEVQLQPAQTFAAVRLPVARYAVVINTMAVTPIVGPSIAGSVIRPVIAPITIAVSVGIAVAIAIRITARVPGIISEADRKADPNSN
jgi:hypothetical protein